MADHKAPTQVTIAPYEESSQLKKTVDAYWKPFTVVAILIAAAILWSQANKQTQLAEHDSSWSSLGREVELAKIGQGVELPSAEALENLSASLEGTSAAPWAMALAVESLINAKEWDRAEEELGKLEAKYPDHALVKGLYPIGAERTAGSLPDRLRSFINNERSFEAAHPELFSLPALPEGSPRVELDTTAGKIVLGLYAEQAPQHVENFLKLVSSGYYDGVKFHRVVPGFMIQSGDPNSKVGDPATWGQGGPDYKIPHEDNSLYHWKGVLAAAKNGNESEESGSQFYITTGEAHHLDGKHTVFGVLLEGEDAVRIIENAPVAPGTERPEEPTVITKATVLD